MLTDMDVDELPKCPEMSPGPEKGFDAIEDSHRAFELSHGELAVAILLESHSVACHDLCDVVLSAVKQNNPKNWKEKVLQCFTDSLRSHVKESLETICPITDLYVILKTLRYRIHDVAIFCGGRLLQTRQQERLCLRVQGVETARNWAFHGLTLSIREVYTSITLLLWIFEALNVRGPPLTALSGLLHYARRQLLDHCDDKKHEAQMNSYKFSLKTLQRTLLYKCFEEFEEKFCKLFHGNGDRLIAYTQKVEASYEHICDLSRLVKAIKQEINKPKKERSVFLQQQPNPKVDCTAICKNILASRHKLAHNEELSSEDITDVIQNISKLFVAFSLKDKCEKVGLYVDRCTCLKSMNIEACAVHLVEPNLETENTQCSADARQRILLPRAWPFIGREEEMDSIMKLFKSSSQSVECQRAVAVMLFGPPGIGKSFLAMEVCWRLRNLYPRQAWVSCSSVCELDQDLNSSNCSQCPENCSLTVASMFPNCEMRTHIKMGEECSGPMSTHVTSTASQNWLYTLDDVCLSTLDLVQKIFIKKHHRLIITTRSSVVKDILQRTQVALKIVRLPEFSTAESLELIRMKTMKFDSQLIDQCLTLAKQAVNTVLGNLPLCVSIYSNLLAVKFSKHRSEWNPLSVGCRSCLSTWSGMEEEYGDRFHVRGLTGVLQSADTYLNDHPLSVFLLIKICVLNREEVLWKVISETIDCTVALIGLTNLGKSSACVKNVLWNLLEIVDWLFSKYGQSTLETCRDALEVLGLISWDSERATVGIHCLTLKCAWKMLESRRFYLDCIVAGALGKCSEEAEIIVSASGLCEYMTGGLLLQSVYRCLHLLDANKVTPENLRVEEHLNVFGILETLVENEYPLSILRNIFTAQQFTRIQSSVNAALPPAMLMLGLPVSERNIVAYAKALGEIPFQVGLHSMSQKSVRKFRSLYGLERQTCFRDASRLPSPPQEVFLELGRYFGPGSYRMAFYHCLIAQEMERKGGSLLRNHYLLKSCITCPPLQATIGQLRTNLLNTKSALLALAFNHRAGVVTELPWPSDKEDTWYILVKFRLIDKFEHGDPIDRITLEAALMLLYTCQLRQLFFAEKIKCLRANQIEEKAAQIAKCYCFLDSAEREGRLWHNLRKNGRFLRALVKAYNLLIEETFYRMDNTVHVKVKRLVQRFWMSGVVVNFIDTCCRIANFLGHFSLTASITKSVCSNVDNVLSAQQLLEKVSLELNREDCEMLSGYFFSNPKFLLLKVTSHLFTTKDLERAGSLFLRLLILTHGWHKHRDSLSVIGGNEQCPIGLISENMFCGAFLRTVDEYDIGKTIKMLTEEASTPGTWKQVLQIISKKLEQLLEHVDLRSTYTHFKAASNALKKNQLELAQKAALKCWRDIIQLMIFFHPMEWILPDVFLVVVLEIADCLKRVYFEKEKYNTAEWFAMFRVKLAEGRHCLYLSTKYGVEYVELLKEMGRLSEALEQCYIVERNLREEFGDDYLEWLPAAPKAAALCHELEQSCNGSVGNPTASPGTERSSHFTNVSKC